MLRTPNSTLPPLLNAIEAFTVLEFPQSETDATDGMPMIIASIYAFIYILITGGIPEFLAKMKIIVSHVSYLVNYEHMCQNSVPMY